MRFISNKVESSSESTWNKILTVIVRSEVPEDAETLKGIFILVIKEEGNDSEKFKAWFDVQGHCVAMKKTLIKATPVLERKKLKY